LSPFAGAFSIPLLFLTFVLSNSFLLHVRPPPPPPFPYKQMNDETWWNTHQIFFFFRVLHCQCTWFFEIATGLPPFGPCHFLTEFPSIGNFQESVNCFLPFFPCPSFASVCCSMCFFFRPLLCSLPPSPFSGAKSFFPSTPHLFFFF